MDLEHVIVLYFFRSPKIVLDALCRKTKGGGVLLISEPRQYGLQQQGRAFKALLTEYMLSAVGLFLPLVRQGGAECSGNGKADMKQSNTINKI